MVSSIRPRFPLLLSAFILLSAVCSGQVFTANLTGLVTDPAGAAVPEAIVRLENIDTQDKRETKTGPEGRFTFSQLAARHV